MAEANIGILLEAIRRAYVYLDGLEEWLRHPRKTGDMRGKISVEGLKNALKAILEHGDLPGYIKYTLESQIKRMEEGPWKTVARYAINPAYIKSILSDILRALAKRFGFEPEMYEKYIPAC